MKLSDLLELLDGELFTKGNEEYDKEILYAFSCDLMSDALMLLRNANIDVCEKGILVTGLVTTQGVRTAEMLDIPIVLLVRGKKPNELVISEAEKSNIIMIGTQLTMYTANGKMYLNGIKGTDQYNEEQ
jgi:hypothetical protein